MVDDNDDYLKAMERIENASCEVRRFHFWEAAEILESGTSNSFNAHGLLDDAARGAVQFQRKGSNGKYEPVEAGAILRAIKDERLRGNALNIFEVTEEELGKYLTYGQMTETSREFLKNCERRAEVDRAIGGRPVRVGKMPWNRGQVLSYPARGPGRSVGTFGGEGGDDGMACFPASEGMRWEEMTLTLFANGVRWEVGGVIQQFSYSEFGLTDERRKSRESKSAGGVSTKKNRLYWFISAIARSPGCLLRWDGKPSGKAHPTFLGASDNAMDLPTHLDGPAARRDFCKRLKSMTGIKEDPFFNYRRICGYQPRFKLVDKRNESMPGTKDSGERILQTRRPQSDESTSLNRELEKLIAEQAEDQGADQFQNVKSHLVKRPTKREDY